MFLKLPLNQKNGETKDFTTDFLMKLDAKLSSAKFKESVLGGKKGMKYTYQPIVRTPVGEDGNPNTDKHPYIKMKLLQNPQQTKSAKPLSSKRAVRTEA